MDSIVWPIIWVACGVATGIAAALASRSDRARFLGRAAVGVLFIAGGALVHVINLATGVDYTEFADDAHFAWVTQAWRAVVAPNQLLFIGLLVVFETAVGILAVSGGRMTRLGFTGVIGFYAALWLFGWFTTVWCLAMLPAMLLLLRAEKRSATTRPAPSGHIATKPRADLGA